MSFKLSLTVEGAAALREWADGIWLASNSIRQETESLIQELLSRKDDLGEHADAFSQFFSCIQKYQELSSEALERLPEMLYEVANKIELYISNSPGDDSTSDQGWQRVRTR